MSPLDRWAEMARAENVACGLARLKTASEREHHHGRRREITRTVVRRELAGGVERPASDVIAAVLAAGVSSTPSGIGVYARGLIAVRQICVNGSGKRLWRLAQ